MAAISETLRQARLRSGVDLDRLADKTKINVRYLQAIEAGDFGKLPSGIFARMFIKQYADALGLDGAAFAEEFQRTMSFGDDSGPPVSSVVEPRNNYHPSVPGLSAIGDRARNDRLASMLSSLIWVVAAILVCAGAYYGLGHLPSRTTSVGVSVPYSTSEHPSAQIPAAPATSPAPRAAPAGSENPQVSGQTPAGTNPSTPVPLTPPPADPIQLTVTATALVWVTGTADGKTVVSEMLPAGATKTFSATDRARITVGNAGSAEITFNGKKLEPLGAKGQVRSAEFTPQGIQVVSRTSPSADPPANPDPLR